MVVACVALPPQGLDAGERGTLPPHGLLAGGRRLLPPDILHAGTYGARCDAVIERAVLIPQRHAVACERRAHVEREGPAGTDAAGRPCRQVAQAVLQEVSALVISVDVRPIDPRPLFRLERLDALELDIEIELQAGEIAIRQIREARMAEGIVLLEEH